MPASAQAVARADFWKVIFSFLCGLCNNGRTGAERALRCLGQRKKVYPCAFNPTIPVCRRHFAQHDQSVFRIFAIRRADRFGSHLLRLALRIPLAQQHRGRRRTEPFDRLAHAQKAPRNLRRPALSALLARLRADLARDGALSEGGDAPRKPPPPRASRMLRSRHAHAHLQDRRRRQCRLRRDERRRQGVLRGSAPGVPLLQANHRQPL